MRRKPSNLKLLSIQELQNHRKEIVRQQIISAHKQAEQVVEKAPRSIRAMKKTLGSTGAVAGDPRLAAELGEITRELNRRRKASARLLARVSPGKLQQMAGDALAQDLRGREEAERSVERDESITVQPKPMELAKDEFSHSPDYCSIRFRAKPYTLTTRQAQVVKMLHEGHKQSTPELSTRHILEKLESETSRLRDTFKNSDLWGNGKLIVQGKRRGSVRLNLPDTPTAQA